MVYPKLSKYFVTKRLEFLFCVATKKKKKKKTKEEEEEEEEEEILHIFFRVSTK